MTAFADENFYKNEYLCGRKAVIDTAFNFYARKATQIIKNYCGEDVDVEIAGDRIKLCCCELAELFYNDEQSGSQSGISSESVGDMSVSYESTESTKQLLRKNIRSVVYSYLADTGLLYRGVRR